MTLSGDSSILAHAWHAMQVVTLTQNFRVLSLRFVTSWEAAGDRFVTSWEAAQLDCSIVDRTVKC